jgi:hypothetical protein
VSIEAPLFQLGPALGAEEPVLVQKPCECKAADAQRILGEKVAASEVAGLVVHKRVSALVDVLDAGFSA